MAGTLLRRHQECDVPVRQELAFAFGCEDRVAVSITYDYCVLAGAIRPDRGYLEGPIAHASGTGDVGDVVSKLLGPRKTTIRPPWPYGNTKSDKSKRVD